MRASPSTASTVGPAEASPIHAEEWKSRHVSWGSGGAFKLQIESIGIRAFKTFDSLASLSVCPLSPGSIPTLKEGRGGVFVGFLELPFD